MGPAEARHHPVKRLGQNFLVDLSIAARIVSLAGLGRKDTVLEPGAGYGTLTRLLQREAGRVLAVEKDRNLASRLRTLFAGDGSVEVIEGDVLRAHLPSFNKVVGTPPYYISSKLVLFLARSKFETAHLVFQKEFGERLAAGPGRRDYGRISITAQHRLRIEMLMPIPRTAFRPTPKVDSVLARFEPKNPDPRVDMKMFDEVVRGIFTQRRRLLKGALLHFLKAKLGTDKARIVLEKLAIPDLRVYEMSIGQLEELVRQLTDALETLA